MEPELTPEEQILVDHSKAAIIQYNQIRHQKGGVDTLYAFIMSDSRQIYEGASFEPDLSHASFCGESHAISNMVLQESYAAKIKSILIADPVPEVQSRGTPPCGTCRHMIWSFGYPDTSVLLMQYVQGKSGWYFPKLEKHRASDFYPLPYEPKPGLWDGWEPK